MSQSEPGEQPFDESVVNAIKGIIRFDDFQVLADLIRHTKIPKGHDAITAAWNRQIDAWQLSQEQFGDIPAVLAAKKQTVEAEAKGKTAWKIFRQVRIGKSFLNHENGLRSMKTETVAGQPAGVYLEGARRGKYFYMANNIPVEEIVSED